MDHIDYALKIFTHHTGRAALNGNVTGLTLLELGPGDSVLSGLIAYAHGVSKTYLVDVSDDATSDMDFYARACIDLSQRGLTYLPDLTNIQTRAALCAASNTTYLTQGLASLRQIPSASVDVVWSHSVLEHVRLHEFRQVMQELKRIQKPGGRASHNIDYQDHLAHALNNLRFPEWLWESRFFADAGFYTNRIQYKRMLTMMRDAGFQVVATEAGYWPVLPTPKKKMATPFQTMNDQDLLSRTGYVLLSAEAG